MVVACWSPKGGSGTTVVAAALGRLLAESRPCGALLVDLAGDLPAALGMPEPSGPGVGEWLGAGDDVAADGLARLEQPVVSGLHLLWRGLRGPVDPARAEVLVEVLDSDPRPIVVDCGRVVTPDGRDGADVARAVASGAEVSLIVVRPCYLALRQAVRSSIRPSGVVVVTEPERALEATDVENLLQVPVVATVPLSPAVGRAVDAGLLASRVPDVLVRALRAVAA